MSLSLGEQLQQLYKQFGEIEGITVELHKQLIAISVNNQAASATVFLQGAQLASYTPKNSKPVIWLSDKCDYKAGKALRGGIPICWPWFGDLQRNPPALQQQITGSAQAHGFVRTQQWQLSGVYNLDKKTTKLTFELTVAANDSWPFPAQLQLTIMIGETLSLQLSVKNTGLQPFKYTAAFHSYFNISHIDDISVSGLTDTPYIDTLDDWQTQQDVHDLKVDQEIDRIYCNSPTVVTLNDHAKNQQMSLTSNNMSDLVVWNPWKQKSKTLTDFDNNAYQNMVCLESACILDNMATLVPGQQHLSTITIEHK